MSKRIHTQCAILFVFLLLLVACESASAIEKRSLSIIENYVDIPTDAREIQAIYFQQGQWRSAYLKFKLPETKLKGFLSTTCFKSHNEFYNEYSNFRATTTYAGTPNWWIPKDTTLTLEGSCDQKGINLGIVIVEEKKDSTVYLSLFIP